MSKKKCFIADCHPVESAKCHYFQPPKDKLSAWQSVFPKKELSKTSVICHKHFLEDDIAKEYENLGIPYKHWRLKAGAVPCVNLDSPVAFPHLLSNGSTSAHINQICETNSTCPVSGPVTHYTIVQDSPPTCLNSKTTTPVIQNDLSLTFTDPLPSSSIPIAQNNSINNVSFLVPPNCDHDYAIGTARPTMSAEKDQNNKSSADAHDSDRSYCVRPSSSTPSFEEACLYLDTAGYRSFISDVRLPASHWCWSFNERTKHLICSSHCISHDGMMTIKTVRILSKTRVQLFINGQSINQSDLKLEFRTKTELSSILEVFHFRNTCQGIVEESLADLKVSDRCGGTKDGNVWRSKGCLGLTYSRGSVLCSKCRILRKYLKLMKKREPKKSKDLKECYKRRLKTSQKALKRRNSKMDKFSAAITELRKERQKLMWNGFDAKIKILNPKEQLVVKTMMAKTKVNPGKNDRLTAMRYDPEILADCLLIKQKSSSVYKHLRSKGILSLPCRATLLKTAKKINLEGLNTEQSDRTDHSTQPHTNQNTFGSDELDPPDSDKSTLRQPLEENMEKKISEIPDVAVAISPEIVLSEAEEKIVSISDTKIIEIRSVE